MKTSQVYRPGHVAFNYFTFLHKLNDQLYTA